jgi:hypothetical protein
MVAFYDRRRIQSPSIRTSAKTRRTLRSRKRAIRRNNGTNAGGAENLGCFTRGTSGYRDQLQSRHRHNRSLLIAPDSVAIEMCAGTKEEPKDWPKNSEMTPYEQTGPGQIATLIGSPAVPRRLCFRTALYPPRSWMNSI